MRIGSPLATPKLHPNSDVVLPPKTRNEILATSIVIGIFTFVIGGFIAHHYLTESAKAEQSRPLLTKKIQYVKAGRKPRPEVSLRPRPPITPSISAPQKRVSSNAAPLPYARTARLRENQKKNQSLFRDKLDQIDLPTNAEWWERLSAIQNIHGQVYG